MREITTCRLGQEAMEDGGWDSKSDEANGFVSRSRYSMT